MSVVDKNDRLLGDADPKVEIRLEGDAVAGGRTRPAANADRRPGGAAAAAEEVSRGDLARAEAARPAGQQEGQGRRLLSRPGAVGDHARPGNPDSRRAAGPDSLR